MATTDPSSLCAIPKGSPGIVMPRVLFNSLGLLPAWCCASQRLSPPCPHEILNGGYAPRRSGELVTSGGIGGATPESSATTSAHVSDASPRTGVKRRVGEATASCSSVANAPITALSRTYFVESTGGEHDSPSAWRPPDPSFLATGGLPQGSGPSEP